MPTGFSSDFDVMSLMENKTKLPMRDFVDQNIFGRLTMLDVDGDILSTIMASCEGDHIEIGAAHGGSALLCAYSTGLPKTDGHIHSMDPFPGYEMDRSHYPPPPDLRAAEANVRLHGLEEKVTFYTGFHPPLPAELRAKRFASAFIDGNHSYEAVIADWLNLKDKVDGIIAFHDVQNPNFGCSTVFEIAQRDPDWEFLYRGGKMGVVLRKGYEFRTIDDVNKVLHPEEYEDEAE